MFCRRTAPSSESSTSSSEAGSSFTYRAADCVSFCRLCTRDTAANYRRLIYGDTASQERAILETVSGPCHHSDGGSPYLCNSCFKKMTRIHHLEKRIERYRVEQLEAYTDLKKIYASSHPQAGNVGISGENDGPQIAKVDVSEKNRQSAAEIDYVSLFALSKSSKRKDVAKAAKAPAKTVKGIIGQYHKILPRNPLYAMISDAQEPAPVQMEVHLSDSPQDDDQASEIQQPIETDHVKVKQEPLDENSAEDEDNDETSNVIETVDKTVAGNRELYVNMDAPFPVAIFENEPASETSGIESEHEETESEIWLKNLVDGENALDVRRSKYPDDVLITESKNANNSKDLIERKMSDTSDLETSLALTCDSASEGEEKLIASEDEKLIDPGLLEFRLRDTHYKCPECDFATGTKDEYDKHMKTHNETKPIICSVCACEFKKKNDLVLHMKSHGSEKPYRCSICGYRSFDCSNAIAHRRTHNLDKRFKCPMCDHRAVCSSNIAAHMKTHTGEKPYKCPQCDYRCARNPNLKRHMVTHINNNLGNSSVIEKLHNHDNSVIR